MLGCCDARAVIVTRCRQPDGQPPSGTAPVARLDRITRLCWGRELDDTSEAEVVAPTSGDPVCCAALADVRTWANELVIERCGEEVWQGPITRLTYGPGGVAVEARDVTAWLDVRVVRDPIDFTEENGTGPVDLAVIAEAVIRSALRIDDPCLLDFLDINLTGVEGELELEPNTKLAGDALRDLARIGLDFTAIGRRIWVGPDTGAVARSTLRDVHFRDTIEVVEDGEEAGTRWSVNGDGVSCVRGGEDPFYGLIERIADEPSITDDDTACTAAESRLDSTNPPPLFVNIPEGASLTPDAPVDITELVPGQAFNVDVDLVCRRVNQVMTLTSLQACYSDEGEDIAVTLAPAGFVGAGDGDA